MDATLEGRLTWARALDPRPIVEAMTDVQRRVYEAARTRQADVTRYRERIQSHNEQVYLRTMQELASRHGCGGRGIVLSERVGRVISEAAEMSADSITNTYNVDLAREIVRIGEDTPTANYRTYRSRLFGDTPNSIYPGLQNWATRRGWRKMQEIARTETGTTLNATVEQFYSRNPQLEAQAELRPNTAACPICQAGIDGNPYRDIETAYARGPWPAHVGCVHYVETTGRVLARDCSELWLGE